MCLIYTCFAQHYALPYDNLPITAKTWEQVSIKWHGGHARLLRPIEYAKTHGFILRRHLKMPFRELGVPSANVTVIAVKPLSQQAVNRIHCLSKGEKPIIGFYVHRTNDVRIYTFKNPHAKISIIHATPVHPFYVKNLQAYISISQVTDSMQLVGNNGEVIHLVCSGAKHEHCGIPYHQGKITTVYNIEVYQKHFYRVGSNSIIVHNPFGGDCGLLQSIRRGFSSSRNRQSENNAAFYIKKVNTNELAKKEVEIWNRYYKQAEPEFATATVLKNNRVRMPRLPHDIVVNGENHLQITRQYESEYNKFVVFRNQSLINAGLPPMEDPIGNGNILMTKLDDGTIKFRQIDFGANAEMELEYKNLGIPIPDYKERWAIYLPFYPQLTLKN